jgi:hypothetical protein
VELDKLKKSESVGQTLLQFPWKQKRGDFLVAILYLGYHGNGRHFEFFQTPQKLLHTTVDIPTHFHEV